MLLPMTARPVTPICARAVEVDINQLSSFDRAARPREAVRRLHRGVRSTTLQTLPTSPVRAWTAREPLHVLAHARSGGSSTAGRCGTGRRLLANLDERVGQLVNARRLHGIVPRRLQHDQALRRGDPIEERLAQRQRCPSIGARVNQPHRAGGESLYHYVPNKDALLYSLAERHLRQAAQALFQAAERLRAEEPPLAETIRQLVVAVTELHTAQPDMHRLLFDHAPRTLEGIARLRQLEQALAREVEFHLRRLEVGGADPALTALLLVQAVEAQIHGAVLDPPAGRTADECGRAVIDLWTRALSRPADTGRPVAGSSATQPAQADSASRPGSAAIGTSGVPRSP
ncbi:hypothetical protein [Nocardia abscessus]|uniref:hypothetical protein n=1 Tax=Nocardia abscessus TaxID=120957 RepID=UPI003CC7CDF2